MLGGVGSPPPVWTVRGEDRDGLAVGPPKVSRRACIGSVVGGNGRRQRGTEATPVLRVGNEAILNVLGRDGGDAWVNRNSGV